MERKRCKIANKTHSFGRFELNPGDVVTSEIQAESTPERWAQMLRGRWWVPGWAYADGTVEPDLEGN